MTRESFEQRLLHLWMTSRVPFTRANLQFYTELDRKRLERWLDELTASGFLEVDSDDAGELMWTVAGAQRPAHGSTQVAEVKKLEALKGEVHSKQALVRRNVAGASLATLGDGEGDKSLIASGVLSFVFGPLGWLYAAPLKDAVPAILLFWLAGMLLPHFLLAPLLGVMAPLSAVVGTLYAWRHNQRGERTSLLDFTRGQLPPRR